MSNDIVYDDIFEAIRHLENGNPFLNLKDKKDGYLVRDFHFNLMEMPNGTIGAFPPNMMFRFFRGEDDDYDLKYPCIPRIYRITDPIDKDADGNRNADLIMIDNLKIADFELVIKEFPQVKYAIEDYCDVDYRALAQHYALNTDLLDVTSDIAVAAFFATHTNIDDRRTNEYLAKEEGVGCIRVYINPMIESELNPFRMIGLQPFQRLGLQCAFAVRMKKDENFSRLTAKVLFKQDAKWNSKIHEAFYPHGRNILCPKEKICYVADLIKKSKSVSTIAIDKYCEENGFKKSVVETVLMRHDMNATDRLLYSLSRQQRRELERKFKERPYGDVKFHSRLCY